MTDNYLNNFFIKIESELELHKMLLIINSHLPHLNKKQIDRLYKTNFLFNETYYLYLSIDNIGCVRTFVSKDMFTRLGFKRLTLKEIYDYDKK